MRRSVGSSWVGRSPEWFVATVATVVVAAVAVLSEAVPDFVAGPFQLMALPFGLAVGFACRLGIGALLVAALLVCLEGPQGYFNPAVGIIAIAPWLIAYLLRGHRLMADQLRTRADELEHERERVSVESVALERTRIARDLHDIVGHCLSIVVVQAQAGERLMADSPELARQALDDIERTADQARLEVVRLVQLLTPESAGPTLRLLDELIRVAAATGLRITYAAPADLDALSTAKSQLAYRVVQEGLTNALRHAPGSDVAIVLSEVRDELGIEITNSAPARPSSGLERSGGGRGLDGMRERLRAFGGYLTAAPTPEGGGGWRRS